MLKLRLHPQSATSRSPRFVARLGFVAFPGLIAFLGLIAFPWATAAVGMAQISFDAVPAVHVDPFLDEALLGDVDGDGHVDLLSMSGTPARLEVRLGDGSREFGPPVVSSIPHRGGEGVLADFTHDGRLDLAYVSDDAGRVVLMRGDGTGAFQLPSVVTLQNGMRRIRVADFNNDGNLDVAAMNGRFDSVSIILGAGVAGWGAVQTIPVTAVATSLTIGDLDEDGDPDIVVTHGFDFITPTGLTILIGDGQGGVESVGDLIRGDNPESVLAGDFDEDGHVDVIMGESSLTRLMLFRGDGNGNLTFRRNIPFAAGPRDIQAVDINHDGHLDLVSTTVSDNIFVHDMATVALGAGDGTFPEVHHVSTKGIEMSLADVDEDGELDMLAGDVASGSLTVHSGRGDGTFETTPFVELIDEPAGAALGDFNEDGHLDLAVGRPPNHPEGGLSIALGDGLGGFGEPSEFLPINLGLLAVGDFDEDLHLDLAAVNPLGGIVVLHGDGTGAFVEGANLIGSQFGMFSLGVDDFDADSHQDIALGIGSTIKLFYGRGDGTFDAAQFLQTSGGNSHAVAADFDEDGLLDFGICTRGSAPDFTARFAVHFNLGGRSYTGATGTQLVDRDPLTPMVADFNEDQHVDVAFPHDGFGSGVTLILGTGGQGLSSPLRVFLGGDRSALLPADFDLDGHIDLAVLSEDPGELAVLAGDGTAAFDVPRRYRVGAGPIGIAGGDLDGDGDTDLVSVNSRSESVSVLRTVAPPLERCAEGLVNAAVGPITDTLFVNGQVGGSARRVVVQPDAPFELRIENPPSREGRTPYVCYLWVGEPGPGTVRFLPFGLGLSCFATPLNSGNPNRIANPIGKESLLGADRWPGAPVEFAPYSLLDLGTGLGREITFYVQALTVDRDAPNGKSAATNGVTVESRLE